MAQTTPPLAVPSSFVSTSPVSPSASSNAFTCAIAFWPVLASSTSSTSCGASACALPPAPPTPPSSCLPSNPSPPKRQPENGRGNDRKPITPPPRIPASSYQKKNKHKLAKI